MRLVLVFRVREREDHLYFKEFLLLVLIPRPHFVWLLERETLYDRFDKVARLILWTILIYLYRTEQAILRYDNVKVLLPDHTDDLDGENHVLLKRVFSLPEEWVEEFLRSELVPGLYGHPEPASEFLFDQFLVIERFFLPLPYPLNRVDLWRVFKDLDLGNRLLVVACVYLSLPHIYWQGLHGLYQQVLSYLIPLRRNACRVQQVYVAVFLFFFLLVRSLYQRTVVWSLHFQERTAVLEYQLATHQPLNLISVKHSLVTNLFVEVEGLPGPKSTHKLEHLSTGIILTVFQLIYINSDKVHHLDSD